MNFAWDRHSCGRRTQCDAKPAIRERFRQKPVRKTLEFISRFGSLRLQVVHYSKRVGDVSFGELRHLEGRAVLVGFTCPGPMSVRSRTSLPYDPTARSGAIKGIGAAAM